MKAKTTIGSHKTHAIAPVIPATKRISRRRVESYFLGDQKAIGRLCRRFCGGFARFVGFEIHVQQFWRHARSHRFYYFVSI
jgi:hypothetical protein